MKIRNSKRANTILILDKPKYLCIFASTFMDLNAERAPQGPFLLPLTPPLTLGEGVGG